MAKYPWYVLTGGPSCGKTSILNVLRQRGYEALDEAARTIIDENLEALNMSAEETRRDLKIWQNIVTRHNFVAEYKLYKTHGEKKLFLDRSSVDNVAYCRLTGLSLDDIVIPNLLDRLRGRYEKVFYLEQLEYQKDYARVEDGEAVKKLNELMPAVYTELGYDLITVPQFRIDHNGTDEDKSRAIRESIEKRADYILTHVK